MSDNKCIVFVVALAIFLVSVFIVTIATVRHLDKKAFVTNNYEQVTTIGYNGYLWQKKK